MHQSPNIWKSIVMERAGKYEVPINVRWRNFLWNRGFSSRKGSYNYGIYQISESRDW